MHRRQVSSLLLESWGGAGQRSTTSPRCVDGVGSRAGTGERQGFTCYDDTDSSPTTSTQETFGGRHRTNQWPIHRETHTELAQVEEGEVRVFWFDGRGVPSSYTCQTPRPHLGDKTQELCKHNTKEQEQGPQY